MSTRQHLSLSGDWVACSASVRPCPRSSHRVIPNEPPLATRMDGAPNLEEQRLLTRASQDYRIVPPKGWAREHVWAGRALDGSEDTVFARNLATGNIFQFRGRTSRDTETSPALPTIRVEGEQLQYRSNIPAERRVEPSLELQSAASHIAFNMLNDVPGSVAGFEPVNVKVEKVAKREGKQYLTVVVSESETGNLFKFGASQSLTDPWDVQVTYRPEHCQGIVSKTKDFWALTD